MHKKECRAGKAGERVDTFNTISVSLFPKVRIYTYEVPALLLFFFVFRVLMWARLHAHRKCKAAKIGALGLTA